MYKNIFVVNLGIGEEEMDYLRNNFFYLMQTFLYSLDYFISEPDKREAKI